MSPAKAKNVKIFTKDTFMQFIASEGTRKSFIDEEFRFVGDIETYSLFNIPRSYFMSKNLCFCMYDTDHKYKISFLDFLYENCFLLGKEIRLNGVCEYVFRMKKDEVVLMVRYDVHSFVQNFLTVSYYYSLEHSENFKPYETYKCEKDNRARLGIFKREFQEIVVHDLLLDDNKKYRPSQYNETLQPILNTVVKELDKNESGMYLFYGEPGTGKSSLIRHLTTLVERQFIYVPPHMVDNIFSFEAIDMFLDRYKGAVLIIEDAEKLLMKRDSEDGYSNSQTMSAILNVTDGLYADITKLSIIATYNCDRNKIDSAILRKGRLKAEFKFEKLTTQRAQTLIDELKLDHTATKPMSLADVYNIHQQDREVEEVRSIGFNTK